MLFEDNLESILAQVKRENPEIEPIVPERPNEPPKPEIKPDRKDKPFPEPEEPTKVEPEKPEKKPDSHFGFHPYLQL